jgi:hypothetical protein
MNSKQAKAEPLPEFLGRLGHEPTSIRGHDVWFRSPFRPDERTPSFKVDRQKNVWYDHGIGAGGTIIDLMVQLEGQADIARVLERIADVLGSPARPLVLPSMVDRPKATPEIESVSAISDRALEAYVVSRGIPLDLARLYLKEVAYRVGEHGYRALGFANDAGGFEVRNANFKGSLGTKDIRFLEKAGSNRAAVFEGFFDFLSVLTHYKRERAESHVLVLNSMALLDRGMERLAAKPIQKIYGYLDHDSAGEKGLATLQERGLWEVVDASRLYDGFKDANAFLT